MNRKRVADRHAETMMGTTKSMASTALMPDPEQVRSRAYEIYCERCEDGRAGDALTDWIIAEGELATGGNGAHATALVGAAHKG